MKKQRRPLGRSLAADVLFASDRTCCVCRVRGKRVQIHHVDDDPSNNNVDNLAVLCLDCHEDTQIRGGFSRRLDAHQVIRYRNDWHDVVRSARPMDSSGHHPTRCDAPDPTLDANAEPQVAELVDDGFEVRCPWDWYNEVGFRDSADLARGTRVLYEEHALFPELDEPYFRRNRRIRLPDNPWETSPRGFVHVAESDPEWHDPRDRERRIYEAEIYEVLSPTTIAFHKAHSVGIQCIVDVLLPVTTAGNATASSEDSLRHQDVSVPAHVRSLDPRMLARVLQRPNRFRGALFSAAVTGIGQAMGDEYLVRTHPAVCSTVGTNPLDTLRFQIKATGPAASPEVYFVHRIHCDGELADRVHDQGLTLGITDVSGELVGSSFILKCCGTHAEPVTGFVDGDEQEVVAVWRLVAIDLVDRGQVTADSTG